MENIEYIDDIINKKEIKIILKELVNEDGKLHNKIYIFENNGKFNQKLFNNFINWLDRGLKDKGNFVINYNTKEINKDKFIENIGDFLEIEIIKKENINKRSKKIIIEGIKDFVLNKVKSFEIQKDLFNILNI